jgi:hypothetical protein
MGFVAYLPTNNNTNLNRTIMKRSNFMAMATLALLPVFVFMSCKKDDIAQNEVLHGMSEKASVEVMLSASPSLYDAVNIDIQDVRIHSAVDGWVSLNLLKPGVYNLHDFTNGKDLSLGKVEVSQGNISQIMIVLGENNTIVDDGVPYALEIPVIADRGFIININAMMQPGNNQPVLIDIDLSHAEQSPADGNFELDPVFNLASDLATGIITGSVFPAEAMPVVAVYNESVKRLGIPDANGFFMIKGIQQGNYTIVYYPRTKGYTEVTLKNVSVTRNKTTELEPVYLGSPFGNVGGSADKP